MATHSSILVWKIPWTESLVGYSPWGHKESDMTEVTYHGKSSRSIVRKCKNAIKVLPFVLS